jgi:hypothetical protein
MFFQAFVGLVFSFHDHRLSLHRALQFSQVQGIYRCPPGGAGTAGCGCLLLRPLLSPDVFFIYSALIIKAHGAELLDSILSPSSNDNVASAVVGVAG